MAGGGGGGGGGDAFQVFNILFVARLFLYNARKTYSSRYAFFEVLSMMMMTIGTMSTCLWLW